MKKKLLQKNISSLRNRIYGNKTLLALLLFIFLNTHNGFSQSGSGLDFDGANDYVACGNIMPATYTKEAWFLVSNLNYQNNLISGGSDGQHALYPSITYGNRISAGHNGTWNAVQDPTPIVANTWYHVALTYDVATKTMKLYKNGVLVSTNTDVAPFTGGNALRIGAYDTGNLFIGKIDEVRIWNRALTQCEIQNNMNGELPAGQTGLVAYYKFNQGVAAGVNTGVDTLIDSSGNANTGTLINFGLTGANSNWITPGGVTNGTTSLSVATTQNFCAIESPTVANLVATGAAIKWYDVATLGTALDVTTVLSSGTYYVTQTTGTCESPRTAVTVTVNTTAVPTATTPQTFDTGATVNSLVATGTSLNWYDVATLGTALTSTTVLATGTYYVSQTLNSCESARTPIQVNIRGAALDFDGTDDYVDLSNNSSLQLYQGTVEAWVKVPTTQSGYKGIVVKQLAYGLFVKDGFLVAYDWISAQEMNTGVDIADATWHHVAMNFINNGSLQVFLDGTLVHTDTDFGIESQISKCVIGAGDENGTTQTINASIDEVRIWNRVLSQGEIQNNMNCELASGQTGLVAYYQFNQGFGNADNSGITSLADASGNTGTGTLKYFALSGASSNFVDAGAVATGIACPTYTLSAVDFNIVSGLSIYPNPSNDVFFIQSDANGTVVVSDLLGKTIQTQKIISGTSQLDLNHVTNGIYLLKITNDKNESKTMKLIKK